MSGKLPCDAKHPELGNIALAVVVVDVVVVAVVEVGVMVKAVEQAAVVVE